MKSNIKDLTNNQADQDQQSFVELSQKEQKLIRGGGWVSQLFCDEYNRLLATGDGYLAKQVKKIFYS